jgi:hypothetical protein
MNDLRFPRCFAALSVVGGVAIALGLPYLTLVHGDQLPVTARLLVITFALVIGGSLVRVGKSGAETDIARRHAQRRVV